MSTLKFSEIITGVYRKEGADMKKGTSANIRQELINNNIIHKKNDIVLLV